MIDSLWKLGWLFGFVLATGLIMCQEAIPQDAPLRIDFTVGPAVLDGSDTARLEIDCSRCNLPRHARAICQAWRVFPTLTLGRREFQMQYDKFKLTAPGEQRCRALVLHISSLAALPPSEYRIQLELDPSQLPMVDVEALKTVSPRRMEHIVFLGSPAAALTAARRQLDVVMSALPEMLEIYRQTEPATMGGLGDLLQGIDAQARDTVKAGAAASREGDSNQDEAGEKKYKYTTAEGLAELHKIAARCLPVEAQIMPGCADYLANTTLSMQSSLLPNPSNPIVEYPRFVAACEIGTLRTTLAYLLYYMQAAYAQLDALTNALNTHPDMAHLSAWRTQAADMGEAASQCWTRCRAGFLVNPEYQKGLDERLSLGEMFPDEMQQLEMDNREFRRRVADEKLIEIVAEFLSAWTAWQEATLQRAELGPEDGRDSALQRAVAALLSSQKALHDSLHIR